MARYKHDSRLQVFFSRSEEIRLVLEMDINDTEPELL